MNDNIRFNSSFETLSIHQLEEMQEHLCISMHDEFERQVAAVL